MDETTYRPYQAHSATSEAAARLDHATARHRVWALLSEAGAAGMTDNELIEALRGEMSANTPRVRRIELVRDDRVVNGGWTRDNCTVWVLKEFFNPQGALFHPGG